MFYALNHRLEGEHLDLCFRETAAWPKVGPASGMPPSLWLSIGDAVSGPAVQLITTQPTPQNLWIDTHYHGSDQFRVMLRGGMQLQRKALRAPEFGYQIAGVPYREGTLGGLTEVSWMFAVHGDRRGARATTTRKDGTFELGEIGEDQLDRLVDSPDDPYWADVPGGSKGRMALATSLERMTGGFAWGSFAGTERWQSTARGIRFTAGLFGDRDTGAAAPLAALTAGTDGVDLVLLIADRRALPRTPIEDPVVHSLRQSIERLRKDLSLAVVARA